MFHGEWFMETWLLSISTQKVRQWCLSVHISPKSCNRLGWHSPTWETTIPVDCPLGHCVGEQGFGCACVAITEIFCMATSRLCVGWEVLQEGQEELLVLCHYNSSYMMDSWHWLWLIQQSGQQEPSSSYQGMYHEWAFSLLRWLILAPHTNSILLTFSVLLASLVSLWPAVSVSHSLLVLVRMVAQIPMYGSLAVKSQCSACPRQGTSSDRSPVLNPLTDRPQWNPRLGGSPVSCFCLICFTHQGTLWASRIAQVPEDPPTCSTATSSPSSPLHSCLSGTAGAFQGQWSPPALPFKTACTASGCAWLPWPARTPHSLLKPPRCKPAND